MAAGGEAVAQTAPELRAVREKHVPHGGTENSGSGVQDVRWITAICFR